MRRLSRGVWVVPLLGLLAGCLPEPTPFRCDLAGGDRACDGVAGSRCVDGSCAAPVPTAVCASGLAFSSSAVTPGRCVPLAVSDAAVDAPSPDAPSPDAPSSDALSIDAPSSDALTIDAPDVRDAPTLADRVALDAIEADRAPFDAGFDGGSDAGRDAPVDLGGPFPDVRLDAGGSLTVTPPARVAKVVGGFFHTCARLVDNRVWCWGSNEQGQLGLNDSTLFVPTPARVNLADVVDVAAGAFHTCALTLGGEVYCWGRNVERQLGVETLPSHFAFAPVRVVDAPTGVTSLALGSSHSCLTTDRAQVFCWGSNSYGAVGISSSANGPVPPTPVPGVTARFVVAGDAFTCAGADARVWCWGRNLYGETGSTPSPPAHTSSPNVIANAVAPGASLDALYAGGFSACARSSGSVRCWGRTDLGAIPGSSAASSQFVPVDVPYYRNAPPHLGYLNQCSVDATDALRCWGANDLGASGNGLVTRIVAPPAAALPFTAQRSGSDPVVGVGAAHACALDSTGVLRCWGARYFGQLGDGRLALLPTPVEVPALQDASALAGGRAFTCARHSNRNEARCAGLNNLGQLGGSSAPRAPLPTTEPAPVTVVRDNLAGMPLQLVNQLAVGLAHGCAITAAGGLSCWGYNADGQVNPMTGAQSLYFGAVIPFATLSASAVTCGAAHTCAVDSLGNVRCWGANDRGQAGQAASMRATGMIVPGLSNVSAVAAGSAFTCARTTAGRVECFGANDLGQCGTGTATSSSVIHASERAAVIASGVAAVTAGAQHACARVGGEVWCWGANHRGQLGAPVVEPRYIARATRVMNLAAAEEVRAAGDFTCARAAGRVWCWGANHRGQLGNGTFTDSAAPSEVLIPRAESVTEIALGEEHACARTGNGRVYCWGSNHLGQLGLSDPLWITLAQDGAVRWPR